MIIQVRGHPGRPRPGGVSFDGNQFVPDVLCGVTAAAGAHPPHSKLKPWWLFGARVRLFSRWSLVRLDPSSSPSPRSSSHDPSVPADVPAAPPSSLPSHSVTVSQMSASHSVVFTILLFLSHSSCSIRPLCPSSFAQRGTQMPRPPPTFPTPTVMSTHLCGGDVWARHVDTFTNCFHL